MKRSVRTLAAVACVALLGTAPLGADVKKEEKNTFKMGGALGRMMGMFMGRQAREGLVTRTVIKGDRKLTQTGDTGQLVDLAEEKVYELDFKKKTHTVKTFEQIRQQMREAQEKMKEQQAKMQAEQAKRPANAPEMEMEVSTRSTGESRQINGFQTKQAITTITMHEKGKTLEAAGGMVLTMDQWLTPKLPGMQDAVDFELKFMQKIGLADLSQEMVMATGMYPMLADMMKRAKVEGEKVEGTPILSVSTFDTVASPEQMQQQERAESDSSSGGGLSGMLARKMMKRKKADETESTDPAAKNRASLMTMTSEVVSVSSDVAASDVALPAGFKERN